MIGEVGPLTLEPIPRGEGCRILGDPTGQRYNTEALRDYLRCAGPKIAVVPTTGVKIWMMEHTRKRPQETLDGWLDRILVRDRVA